jgi:hypothetical protein
MPKKRKTPDEFISGPDKDAILKIRACGFIGLSSNGEPFLASGAKIESWQFNRLLKLGLLEPRGDSLFDGPSQTYILKEEANAE